MEQPEPKTLPDGRVGTYVGSNMWHFPRKQPYHVHGHVYDGPTVTYTANDIRHFWRLHHRKEAKKFMNAQEDISPTERERRNKMAAEVMAGDVHAKKVVREAVQQTVLNGWAAGEQLLAEDVTIEAPVLGKFMLDKPVHCRIWFEFSDGDMTNLEAVLFDFKHGFTKALWPDDTSFRGQLLSTMVRDWTPRWQWHLQRLVVAEDRIKFLEAHTHCHPRFMKGEVMSDKEIYIAYVLDESDFGTQLLRYAFEHPIVEYWGEPEEQVKLCAYFQENHYSGRKPLIVERAHIVDFMPYVMAYKDGQS